MPRTSKDALAVAHIGPGAWRLDPPAELGEVEAAIFRQTVASVPHDHFSAEDTGLLCAYVRARVLERRAFEELEAGAVVAGSTSPWLAVHIAMVRSLSTLAVRLRLGPKSRHPNNSRSSKPTVPPSYYQLMDQQSPKGS
jgi:phage terminase small subunit